MDGLSPLRAALLGVGLAVVALGGLWLVAFRDDEVPGERYEEALAVAHDYLTAIDEGRMGDACALMTRGHAWEVGQTRSPSGRCEDADPARFAGLYRAADVQVTGREEISRVFMSRCPPTGHGPGEGPCPDLTELGGGGEHFGGALYPTRPPKTLFWMARTSEGEWRVDERAKIRLELVADCADGDQSEVRRCGCVADHLRAELLLDETTRDRVRAAEWGIRSAVDEAERRCG